MSRLFLESPYLLSALLVALMLVLIGIWSSRRTPLARRMLLVGFLLCPLLLGIQAWVKTDREQLIRICRDMAANVEAVDAEGFCAYLSDEFSLAARRGGADITKADMLKQLQRLLDIYRIEQPRLRSFNVKVEANGAVVTYAATCKVIMPDQIWPMMASAWELSFQRQNQQWRVISLSPRPTPTFPFSHLDDIPR